MFKINTGQVFESENEHRQVVNDLRERLMRMEEESGRHQQVIDNITHENSEAAHKLVEAKAMLQVCNIM